MTLRLIVDGANVLAWGAVFVLYVRQARASVRDREAACAKARAVMEAYDNTYRESFHDAMRRRQGEMGHEDARADDRAHDFGPGDPQGERS